MVDSHCHLGDEVYGADREAVIARARDAGVTWALCIVEASDPGEFDRVRPLADGWPGIRLASGVHPHRAATCAADASRAAGLVRAMAVADARVLAIGEIGLDYHYDLSPREVQRAVFAAQLDLARELDLPAIVHTREADEDTVRLIDEAGPGAVRGVFHCFSGDEALARRAVDLGFYVSFSGILTFKKADAVKAAAAVVPVDRLLIETDCPYLAPVPHRGKRNEPAWVAEVLKALALIRRVSEDELAGIVTSNFVRLFRPLRT